MKLVSNKISVSLKNTNSKPGWEIQLEMQIRNLQQAKMIKQWEDAGIHCEEKKKATRLK